MKKVLKNDLMCEKYYTIENTGNSNCEYVHHYITLYYQNDRLFWLQIQTDRERGHCILKGYWCRVEMGDIYRHCKKDTKALMGWLIDNMRFSVDQWLRDFVRLLQKKGWQHACRGINHDLVPKKYARREAEFFGLKEAMNKIRFQTM